MILLHVIDAVGDSTLRDIDVWSPATDALILLMDLVTHGRLGAFTKLNLLTGKGDKNRSINIRERVSVTGRENCQCLFGFHNFTCPDWGGNFFGISKKSWITSYLSLPNDDPPSSLPSISLAKGCSQAMSCSVSCPKKCGPSRSLFDRYTAPGVQLPYQPCGGNCSGPGIWRARSFLRPEQH